MSTDYYRKRRTLADKVEIDGIGIHTNSETRLLVEPAESGEGIKFVRTDLDEDVVFRPSVNAIEDIPRATVLSSSGEELYTVEHILAAFFGLGITDATVYVEAPEIPALNGSAEGFIEIFRQTGLEELQGKREIYRVNKPLYVEDGDQSIVLLPATEFKISCTISFDNEYIGDQYLSYSLTPDSFGEEIAPARTFGFKEEIEDLLENNLALGGSLDNAIVLDEDGNLMGDEPQFPDEFVRHKVLDIIGDLALLDTFIVGHVVAVKNSHFLNVALAEKLAGRIKKSPAEISNQARRGGDEMMNIDDVLDVLPHRYPLLLVDRILSMDHDKEKAVGLKNVTMNEEFFQGHFPGDPIMPGVLIIEAIAQLGAAWILSRPGNEGKNIYFMGVDNVKWRKPVRPGDQLVFEVTGKRLRSRSGMMEGKAYTDGEVATEGLFKFALVD